MMKKILSFLLALTLILASAPVLADDTQGSGESPSISMTLNNFNQVTDTSITPGQSPTMSMTLQTLNQVTQTGTNPVLSPSLSMTLNTLTQFSATVEGYGVSLGGLFTIMDTLSADARTAFDAIAAYVGRNQAVAGYFGADIPGLVENGNLSQSYLDFDFSQWILSEYVSLGINQELETGVNVTATFGFASEYADGQTVVAMFGYRTQNGDIVWQALNTVAVDGQVRINFSSDLLRLAGSEAILGILS